MEYVSRMLAYVILGTDERGPKQQHETFTITMTTLVPDVSIGQIATVSSVMHCSR